MSTASDNPKIVSRLVDAYLDTIERLEPDIAMIDAGAAYASAAISLKRIADSLEKLVNTQAQETDQ